MSSLWDVIFSAGGDAARGQNCARKNRAAATRLGPISSATTGLRPRLTQILPYGLDPLPSGTSLIDSKPRAGLSKQIPNRRLTETAAAATIIGILLVGLALCGNSFAVPSGTPAVRKQQARTQFETAERMREALNGRPESERTRKDYQKVADAYRKVYYVSPASSKADESIMDVAEILAEMGHQFAPDDKDLHAAIGQYEFLRKEYPGSKYRMEALFTIGQIYKEDLGDDAAAKATFAEFLKKHPHNQLAPKAQEALAELSQPKAKKKTEVAAKATAGPPMDADTPTAKAGAATRVTGIRYWSTADYTRVAIDLDAEVKYEAGRVPDPDRIFFDLPDTRLVSTLVGKSFDVQDGFLKKIRVAQYQQGSTRVVLEVDNVAEYSAFLLPNPYRLIVDIHGKDSRTESQVAAVTAVTSTTEATAPKHAATAAAAPLRSEPKAEAQGSTVASVPKSQAASKPDAAATKVGGETTAATTTTAFKSASGALVSASAPAPKVAEAKTSVSKPGPAVMAQPAADDDQTTKPTGKQAAAVPQTVASAAETTAKKGGSKKSAKSTTADVTPVHVASPTSEGDRSLIRALGLKIGTIVIDAGHGGHDTGTIGPNGLLEKDLVLDVALRLGKLLESRLGAQVIYTRDDDTFIPLETRTAIANEHRADMFISVHANSSRDESARGVETYYLNFTTNSDALEVAARENAVSEQSVYQLQDLVKKITLKDKIEESKELAGDVQTSLYAGLSPKNPTLRNRGVKKAPFVVLIGANMPSILAEISFVSNPTDETKLQTPEYRQKIAESLYRGIAKYADGLSGVKVASKLDKESGK